MTKKTELKLTEYESGLLECHTKETQYFNNGKTTVVILTMNNGFDVVGESSCVHRDMFDSSIGRHYALVDALRKAEKFIGFGRQQESYEQQEASVKSPLFYEKNSSWTEEHNHEKKVIGEDSKKANGFITGGIVNAKDLTVLHKSEHILSEDETRAFFLKTNNPELTVEKIVNSIEKMKKSQGVKKW